jgi:hypothetical protein
MKALFLFLLSFNLFAVELKFIGPCDSNPIARVEVFESYANVGELTIKTLEKFDIPFKGTEQGLASAFETPTGDDSVEILGDTEMRAYGWCFSVDGESPDLYPHEVSVSASTKTITWLFGFAHYKNGQWLTQCTPAHQVKPRFLCED